MPRTAVTAIGAVALAAATVRVGQLERFVAVGPNLLRNGAFGDGLADWVVAGIEGGTVDVEDGSVVLRPGACPTLGRCGAVVEQRPMVPADAAHLLVGVEVAVERLEHAGGADAFARVMLVTYRDGRPDWSVPHEVYTARDAPWEPQSAGFAIEPPLQAVGVVLQVQGTSGALRARNVTLHRAEYSLVYRVASAALLLGWTAWFVALGWPMLALARSRWPARLVVLAAAAIVVGVLSPSTVKTSVSDAAVMMTRRSTPPASSPGAEPDLDVAALIRKLTELGMEGAHFVLFALLTAAARRSRPESSAFWVVAGLIAFAVATELLQLFTLDRSPSWSDLGLDVAGIAFGLALGSRLSFRRPAAPPAA